MIFSAPLIACKICGKETQWISTSRCDTCWALERRIEADPKIAIQILQAIDEKCMASITNLESLAEYLQNAAENFETAGKEQLFQILDTAAYRVRNASLLEKKS